MIKQTRILVALRYLALAACVACLSACTSVKTPNKTPTAVITVLLDGQPLNLATPIPFMDQPVTITLDGSHSTDADGHIVQYMWRRTDVSAAARWNIPQPAGTGGAPAGTGGAPAGTGGAPAGTGGAPAGGGDEDGGIVGTGGAAAPPMMPAPAPAPMMPAVPKGPAFTEDPAAGVSSQATLTEKGKYKFSLWVKDDSGTLSKPATVTVKLGGFSPDMACMPLYTTPKADCRDCTCTPDAMGGCLDEAKACLANPDPMFKMLCTAVVNCAVMKNCTGAACYTGGCMAEITNAAMYMGGAFPAGCDMGMAATNPCGASAALSTCQASTMKMCADVCK
jgi:hypothetical protein